MEDFGIMVRHDALMERRWKEIGDHIAAFVDAEGLTWEAFYETSGVSEATVSKIRKGEPIVRRDKRAAICRAIGWSNDSIDLVLRGEEPVNVSRPNRQRAAAGEIERLRRELTRALLRLDAGLEQVETNAAALVELKARVDALEEDRSGRSGRPDASSGG